MARNRVPSRLVRSVPRLTSMPSETASASTSCCPVCARTTAHCNRHSQMCMQRLGRSGALCDQALTINATGTERVRSRDGIRCLSMRHTLAGLKSYAERWANATDKGRTHSCFNQCSSRGTCVNGWCSCDAGSFGIDCAHSASARPAAPPRAAVLALYVYELPPALAFTYGRATTKIYQAERLFLTQLLADRSVRVLEPEAADLFVVPFFSVYSPAENNGCEAARLSLVYRWLDTHHTSLWRRRAGRDHVIWLTGDRGACGLGAVLGAHPIFVSHWGLLGTWTSVRPIALLGSTATDVLARTPDVEVPETAPNFEASLRAGRWCHQPHTDVLVPPYVPDTAPDHREASPETASPEPTRPYLLVHAGGICGWRDGCGGQLHRLHSPTGYSLGMRQRLFRMWGGEGGRRWRLQILNHSASGKGGFAKLVCPSLAH